MSLNVTQVHRNLQQRVTFLYLEFEDLFVILGLAALTNVLGRFLRREIFGVSMNVFLQYVVPVLAIPFLILFKYGKPRGYRGAHAEGRVPLCFLLLDRCDARPLSGFRPVAAAQCGQAARGFSARDLLLVRCLLRFPGLPALDRHVPGNRHR